MSVIDSIVSKALRFTPRPIVRIVANRYIAGETVEDAMKTVARLNGEGAVATVDALGEFVKSAALAKQETELAHRVLDEIKRRDLKSGLSVKLTSLGLEVDESFCRANVEGIVAKARDLGLFVRIDMENSPHTDATLSIARDMWAKYPERVGVVLQAYLKRTLDDIHALAPTGMSFRLCKGIYNESETIAYKDREEIRENYLRCLAALFDRGSFVGIATHDDPLIDGALRMIRERDLKRDEYEFQMLLGVRDPKRRELIAAGHRTRVYVPFGEDWYGYSIRRLRENPAIAGHVFKAIFSR